MFLSLASARRRSMRGIAMALALAGGAAAVSAAFAPSAYAQSNSRGFERAYSPIAALTTGETPNWAAAAAQFETLVAAIENEDDRNVAGSFALQLGRNTNSLPLQRRGLEMMLQSGKVAPEQVGMFQFYVGNFALQGGDLPAAKAALQLAVDSGFSPAEAATDISTHPRSQLLRIMLELDQGGEAANQVRALVNAGTATVHPQWIRYGLQGALDAEDVAGSLALVETLVKSEPTPANWNLASRVVQQSVELDDGAQLDLLRLLRAAGAMTQRGEYTNYVQLADPRIMSNEVLPVLAEAVAAGLLQTSDPFYVEVQTTADARSAADRRDIETTVREGQAGAALDASVAGDVLWSLGDYARAETMFALAMEKGGDRDTALTRVGMAQVMQGKYAEAIATLAPVSGPRQPVASLWATWAQEKLGG